MKRRMFVLVLAVMMLLGSVTAYADTSGGIAGAPSHEHYYGKSETVLCPTEAKTGILRYYCTGKVDGKACTGYKDELIPELPDVYVSKFRHEDAGLCTRITIAKAAEAVGDELGLTIPDWIGKQMAAQYNYNWEDAYIKQRALEFKAEDVGIGTFDSKVNSYSITVPVSTITACEENGAVVVYLTTGAAMLRLGKDATAALVEQAKESIGVQASRDDEELNVELLVDGKVVSVPNGVEMLYWVKDAGDQETASEELLAGVDYMNFDTEGEFDLIYVESLNGVVNCNK